MDITGKIQALRLMKGWSVARLARETSIPVITLRTMFNRNDPNNYNVKNLIKIANALGVTVSYLTLDDHESESPALTNTQYDDFMNRINNTLKEYFTIIQPNAKNEHQKAMEELENDLIDELED